MRIYTFLLFLFAMTLLHSQTKYPEINSLINGGNFSEAKKLILVKISTGDLSAGEIHDLNFQIEKMDRIKRDFRRTREDITSALKKYYPSLTEDMINKWESEKKLEMKKIDGEKRYFANAVPNLFRLDKDAAGIKNKIDGEKVRELDSFLSDHIPQSINKIGGGINGNPVKIKIDYTLTVDADAVPDGEIIRCWLPYPREDNRRQKNVKLFSVNSGEYTIASGENLQRTLYLEKPAKKGEPVVFNMKLEYESLSEWHNIDPDKIKPYDKNSSLYIENTSERLPHIEFTEDLKKLSGQIVGEEKNPYLVSRKIFEWIHNNIPWASALEYSTIDNISSYCLSNMHGDCGIKTLLFMTLVRMNGIPAKWQSGWMMHPPEINLHDWCEIYLEGYGWVPVDQSFGLQKSGDEKVKYFYLGGMDSYRLIVNDDYSMPLYPAKIYPRSETVDFQRGEVEWRGGNLYFDKWDYNMKAEYSE
jgi:transglutaminase-like putative cysteine protease